MGRQGCVRLHWALLYHSVAEVFVDYTGFWYDLHTADYRLSICLQRLKQLPVWNLTNSYIPTSTINRFPLGHFHFKNRQLSSISNTFSYPSAKSSSGTTLVHRSQTTASGAVTISHGPHKTETHKLSGQTMQMQTVLFTENPLSP